MNNGTEIERRFVVLNGPTVRAALSGCTRVSIEQGYLETLDPGVSIRVRIINSGKCLVTYKLGRGLVRQEDETPVDLNSAILLMRAAPYKLTKTRFYKDGWEIDFFSGALDGLVLAEKEMASVDEYVDLPQWLGPVQEVTDSITNLHLARLSRDVTHIKDSGEITKGLFTPRLPVIVVTGGPCSGKSTLLSEIPQHFPLVRCIPETATILIGQVGIKPPNDGSLQQARFQQAVYRVQRGFEEVSVSQAALDKRDAIITDRGTLDCVSYLDGGRAQFESICCTTVEHEYSRYDRVIFLAAPTREVFERNRANNTARLEGSYEKVVATSERTLAAWAGHPGLTYINGESWEEKSKAAISAIEEAVLR